MCLIKETGETRLGRKNLPNKAARRIPASPTLPTETARPDPRRTSLGSGFLFFNGFACKIFDPLHGCSPTFRLRAKRILRWSGQEPIL